jgi:hypothetical protein
MFWQVLMIGFMDGIIMSVAILSLFRLSILISGLVGAIFWFCHWLVYKLMALKRENEWIGGDFVPKEHSKPKK